MGKVYPLVSVFITYFNTGKIVYETVDSVLSQDYPNIELIISDDASARDPMGEMDRYIEQHKRENIRRVIIRRNEENLGTVKHVELIHDLCTGEFCCGIAGDDLFHDEHVISAMIERFEELGPKAEYLIAQVEMFDQKMERSYGYCVQKSIIQLMKNENWEELLNEEIASCKLVGQNMSRTSLYKRLPKISESYCLVEDYSTHLRLLRKGIPIYWCDIIMIKHRGGGMSHGNISNKPEVYAKYCEDYMTIFEIEIEPFRRDLDESCYLQAVEAYKYFSWQREMVRKMTAHATLCKIFSLKDPRSYVSFVNTIQEAGRLGMIVDKFRLLIFTLIPYVLLMMTEPSIWQKCLFIFLSIIVAVCFVNLLMCTGIGVLLWIYRQYKRCRPVYM